ncbi:MAG: monovalent cation/H+ antiporter complex subunit F [Candidatus Sumerlaeia bacterium]|nr:monovalent cation/H+ antiporter complex subunit F [Candidatus Sumerlaeia bacterium]
MDRYLFLPHAAVLAVIGLLALSLVLVVVRFVKGPTAPDRLAAFEAFTLILLCIITIYGLFLGTAWFMDVVLVISLLGFLSTIAVAKYIEQGSINDE